MKSLYFLPLLFIFPGVSFAQNSTLTRPVTFRVIFGEADTAPTRWDGAVSATGARISRIEPWRAGDDDHVDGTRGWKMSTVASPPGTEQRLGKIAPKGVIIAAEGAGPKTRFDITTPNGKFSFTPAVVSFTQNFLGLGGKVRVERVPEVAPIVKSDGDQDNPAMALSGDTVYLTYTEFAHSNREQESFAQRKQSPANFDWLSRPAGGDQVKLIRYSISQGKWSEPEDVSPKHEDVMRSAVAVDGSGRVWVIWSANRGGNFDLYARYFQKGQWSREIRVTTDPGTDVNPVATTDSAGRVWIAWQAYRGNNLDIAAAAQTGDRFTSEQRVSFSPASDWDPAIAASPKGEIAVSWDTYDKGDYDVYARVMRFGQTIQMEDPVPVAASTRFEARSSAAYDGAGRLWVAYESSDEKWGKDFGVYDIKGVSLYRGQTVRVRYLDQGLVYENESQLESALKFAPGLTGREGGPNMKRNNPGMANVTVQGPRNSIPRLVADDHGRVFLTFRSGAGLHSQVGSIYQQFVTFCTGSGWSPATEVPSTEGPVDLRPALVAVAGGQLIEAAITDNRKPTRGPVGEETTGSGAENLDRTLVAITARVPEFGGLGLSTGMSPSSASLPAADVTAERAAIATMRAHRVQLPSGTFQVMRGEFHRHTEFSADGGAMAR